VVRRDVVAARVARAAAWLDDVERTFAGPVETLLADVKERDLALFYLFLAIQECIDLAAHWVADEGWSPADDAGSTFDVLAGRGVIDLETAEALRSAAGLRNRIAHGYALLDARRVRDEARQGLPSLRAFLSAAARAAGL